MSEKVYIGSDHYEQIASYLLDSFKNSKFLGEQNSKYVLLLAMRDYFDNKYPISLLSAVASSLCWSLNDREQILNWNDRELSSLIDVGALQEATYFEFKIEEKNVKYVKKLKELVEKSRNYYLKNKHLLKLPNI